MRFLWIYCYFFCRYKGGENAYFERDKHFLEVRKCLTDTGLTTTESGKSGRKATNAHLEMKRMRSIYLRDDIDVLIYSTSTLCWKSISKSRKTQLKKLSNISSQMVFPHKTYLN